MKLLRKCDKWCSSNTWTKNTCKRAKEPKWNLNNFREVFLNPHYFSLNLSAIFCRMQDSFIYNARIRSSTKDSTGNQEPKWNLNNFREVFLVPHYFSHNSSAIFCRMQDSLSWVFIYNARTRNQDCSCLWSNRV